MKALGTARRFFLPTALLFVLTTASIATADTDGASASTFSVPKIETALGTTSFGSYGEVIYNVNEGSARDEINLERLVFSFSHDFNEWISLSAEIELEEANEIEAEQAYLEMRPFSQTQLAFRGGLLLVPISYFNLVHEPTTFYSVERPDVDLFLTPSTWRELGIGVAGQLNDWLTYELQINDSLALASEDGEFRFGDAGTQGTRGLRQQGHEASFGDVGVAGRVTVTPTLGLTIGGSFFTGEADHSAKVVPGLNPGGDESRVIVRSEEEEEEGEEPEDEDLVALPQSRITILEADARFVRNGFELRGEYAIAMIGKAGELSELAGTTIGSTQQGFYIEPSYDVLRLVTDTEQRLQLYYRYSWIDLQSDVPSSFARDEAAKWTVHGVGVAWFPIPQVVAKLDYEARHDDEGERPNRLNVGLGYSF